jgi:hypothetical protein
MFIRFTTITGERTKVGAALDFMENSVHPPDRGERG